MSAAASGGAAAAAAAERKRKLEEEEQEMTDYEPHELREGWEFKIIRSMTGAFKHPEKMREILDEEARAGWVLVEKFDNGRLRLKRPASARQKDQLLGTDPYRTFVGYTEGQYTGIVLAWIFGAIIFIGAFIATMVAVFG
jgi:hypothetical protein